MTALAPISPDAQDLPSLIDRAASMLSGAKTAAEVLEARDMAGFAYDVAKRAARLQRAKSAHDDLVAAAHRAQAHALEIEACANVARHEFLQGVTRISASARFHGFGPEISSSGAVTAPRLPTV